MLRRIYFTSAALTLLFAAGLAWRAWPSDEERAQDAIVRGLIAAAGPKEGIQASAWDDRTGHVAVAPLDPAARAAAEATVADARLYGHRGGAPAARALVMDRIHDLSAWLAWVELSEPGAPGALSAVEAAAVAGWLERQGGFSDVGAVAQAWVAVRADAGEQVGALVPAPASLPAELRESGLAVVIAAKESLGADAEEELVALHALAPTHRRPCVSLGRKRLLEGDLVELEALATACLRAGPPIPELGRARAAAADLLGRPEAARAAYLDAGFTLHAAAVAAQEGLPAAEADWRAAVGDPAPPAALHRVLGGILLGDLEAVRSGVDALEGLGGGDPTLRLGAAAGALALGEPARALALIGALDGVHAEVLRARALAGSDPAGARAALDRAWALGPDLAVAAARVALFPDALDGVRAQLAAADPIEVGLYAQPVERERPWPALLPPGPDAAPRRPPLYGLPASAAPPGLDLVLERISAGRCAAGPAAPPRVAALCGAGQPLAAAALEDPTTRIGDLALALQAASAAGDRAGARAAAVALTRRAPGLVGPARLRQALGAAR